MMNVIFQEKLQLHLVILFIRNEALTIKPLSVRLLHFYNMT